MIIKRVSEDIWKTDILGLDAKHIVFAANVECQNIEYAGMVSYKYWKDLDKCLKTEMGSITSKTIGDKTFHAVVCYSKTKGFIENQREFFRDCFDKLPTNGEAVVTYAIGGGMFGLLRGANLEEIICGMHESKQPIILYANFSLDNMLKKCEDEKVLRKKI